MKKHNTLLAAAIAAILAAPVAFAAGGAGSAGAGSSTSGTTQMSAERAFEKLDANNDGFISKPEAGIAPDVIVIFPAADMDKDEKLSRSEYDEGMKSRASQGATKGSGSATGGATSGQRAMPEDRVAGERKGPGNLRPGKDEGDYTPQGQLGGDPLRSPPAASGSGR